MVVDSGVLFHLTLAPLTNLLPVTDRLKVPIGRDDGATALTYVTTQLNFGPRIPNTDGARRCGDWIIAQMRAHADTVLVQSWTHTTVDGKPLALRNIIARWRPQATDRVLYVTHWDSRPVSDDDTRAIARTRANLLIERGVHPKHLRRPEHGGASRI